MEEKLNKNKKILLILGVMFLLVLLIGSTFAYFAVNTTDNTSSTVITGKTESVGNATLSTLVESLHINLSATDMAVTNAGKYYATSEEGKDYEPNKSAGYYDLAQLSLTSTGNEEDNNIYTCNTTLKITLDTAEQDSMISELQTGDVIFHTFVNGHNTDYDLSDIKETGSKEINVEIESVGSNTKNIRGYLEFTNKKEDDQSKLAGKNLKVTIETEGLSCEVTGKAVEADGTKVSRFIGDNIYTSDDACIDRNKISFVDYIDESIGDYTDLSKAEDGSIKGWLNQSDNIVYIGSYDKIFVKDMSNMLSFSSSCSYPLTLDNLIFDRTTTLDSTFSYNGAKEIKFSESIDTSKVTNMIGMVWENRSDNSLNTLDFSIFDTSNVENMGSMFEETDATELDLSNFDTSNVTRMGSMFSRSYGLTELDLSNFDTSNVTDMDNMFAGCTALKHLDLRSFDFSKAYSSKSITGGTNGLDDIFNGTSDLVVIVKDATQKGYIQAEADKAGVTIKIAGEE